MANFITDLNKMVNTIQKVDKLLTDKPKRKRIKSIIFTNQEKHMIKVMCEYWLSGTDEELQDGGEPLICKNILNKIK